MIRRPPRSTPLYSSAASDVYKRQDDLLRSGLRFLLKLKGRGITPSGFQQRALELHSQHWSAQVNGHSPNGSGGPDPARAELEAIDVLFVIYTTYEDALKAAGLRDFD